MKKTNLELLRLAGLKRTEIRETVLDILREENTPLSHQELMEKKALKSFDRVTVYRTLESFHEATLLHRVLGADGAWRFCFHEDEKEDHACQGNHIHFFCRECKKMSCLPEQGLPWISAPKGAIVESKQLLVHGLCAKCASQKTHIKKEKL